VFDTEEECDAFFMELRRNSVGGMCDYVG
jgi:hypothetical protein